jgi:hypothetical protein
MLVSLDGRRLDESMVDRATAPATDDPDVNPILVGPHR